MFKNHFLIAWRNITKSRFYSMVNIIGLTTGLVFTLMIGAYVWNELQINTRLRNADRQYFLSSEWKDPNMGVSITSVAPLSQRLRENYPGLVANYYRWDGITSVVSKGDKHFREGIQVGDSTLLSMFGFDLQYGDKKTALNNPYSVVIAKDKAIKYFGKPNATGETITIQSFAGTTHDFLVTGVLKDMPENSVTQLNDQNHNGIFIPTNTSGYFGRLAFNDWANIYAPSYIELQPGVSPKALEQPIKYLLQQHAPDFVKQNLTVHVNRLTDYYLEKDRSLVKRMLYALSYVGLFILIMAIVNFVNISISNSSARMKEIGIRKVLGGLRKQIILQFLAESVILVLIATVLAVILYPFSRSLFENMVGKQIPSLSAFPVYFVLVPAVAVLVIGFFAGLYPAFVLSSFKSIDALKGKLKTVKEKVWLRKSLAGFQFCIASIVMIAAYIVSQQVSYFFSRNLGYNKEYIVSSQVPRDWSPAGVRKMETIRNEFATMPQVSNVALSFEIPNGMNGGQPLVYKPGTDSTQAKAMQLMVTDEHYLDTYQIPLKAGAYFSSGSGFDSSKVVLNETAVKTLGFNSAEEALNRQVWVGTGTNKILCTVQGVTKDFHFNTMQMKIDPFIIVNVRLGLTYRYLSFKVKPGNVSSTIEAIQKKWAVLLPGSSFEYTFMDDTLKQLYKTELQLKKASYTATVLSLIIALLGVLGLISLSVQKRTKEIGIRKVLGASVPSIISLFIKEFLSVIVVAGIIACPIAYFLVNDWLSDYAYRITLTAAPFIICMGALALLTVILIVLQTIKAGVANPVKSLRTE